MTVAVEAIYEDGVLRPEKPLGFKEHSRVRVIVEDESETQPNVDNDPTGWKTAHELIGCIKEELVADRIAENHDKHLSPNTRAGYGAKP